MHCYWAFEEAVAVCQVCRHESIARQRREFRLDNAPGQVQMQRRQAEGLLAFLIFTDPTFVEVCWRLHPSNCSRSKPQLRSHDIGPFPVAATALGRIQKYATSSDCNKDCSSLGLRPLSLESLHCCRFLILVAERVLIGPPVRQHSLLGLA